MTPMELENLIKQLQEVKAESQTLELKAAEKGYSYEAFRRKYQDDIRIWRS